MTQPDPFDLETAFAEARRAPPQMSDALAGRIVADAQAHLPSAPLWQRVLEAIGGPAGLGGLVTATVAGFWLGVAPPAETFDPLVLIGTVESAVDADMTDLIGFDWDIEEG